MQYRQDIQLLRGIAVLFVVLFHLGVPGFNSGFLGVDVFFVVSGYLMAVMYDPLRKTDFFIKRASRLLPAYFTVVIVTLLFSAVFTSPIDFRQVTNQALFASIFASNVGFWMENSYFDKAAFKPLLHLWSLGVEIQFYLLVPLLVWVFGKIKSSYLFITTMSAIVCFIVVLISPKTSFFWLPFRLWEFLIGFGVATYLFKARVHFGGQGGGRSWLGFGGVVTIICLPLISIDGQANNFLKGHPGIISLFISLATATVLAFGLPSAIIATRIASFMEKIGNYSYSIYLAHFPIIVLFLYQPFHGTVLKSEGITQSASHFILVASASALLYTLVEKPGRTRIKKPFRWFVVSIIVVLAISQIGALFQRANIPPKEMLIYEAWEDRDVYRCGKLNRIFDPFAIICEITAGIHSPSRRVLFVGNSHADSIKATFKSVAEERNIAVYFIVENEPLMRTGKVTPQALIEEALSRSVDALVLHYAPGSLDIETIKLTAQLAKSHKLRLAYIMPVPVWDRHIPMALLSNVKTGQILPTQKKMDYLLSNRLLIDLLENIKHEEFKIYYLDDVLCGRYINDDCQFIAESGRPLYFDSAHLTLTGSALLQNVLDQVLTDLL